MRPRLQHWLAAALLALLVAGCGNQQPSAPSTTPSVSPTPSVTAPLTPTPPSQPPRTMPASPATSAAQSAERKGIDASHHQGPIKWPLVAGSGITFAYLKATEGSGFVDPTFVLNAERAQMAGLDVGGYHFFKMCSAPAPQAAHFIKMLAQTTTTLPPAVDVEKDSCQLPRATLVQRVREFTTAVAKATDKQVVLYVYPDVEARYQLRKELAQLPQWVRSIGTRPKGEWWMWQQSDSATVAGIAGRADLNLMRHP